MTPLTTGLVFVIIISTIYVVNCSLDTCPIAADKHIGGACTREDTECIGTGVVCIDNSYDHTMLCGCLIGTGRIDCDVWAYPAGVICKYQAPCNGGSSCINGNCTCPGNMQVGNGQCKQGNGGNCGTTNDCLSSFICVDGKCSCGQYAALNLKETGCDCVGNAFRESKGCNCPSNADARKLAKLICQCPAGTVFSSGFYLCLGNSPLYI